MPNRKAKWGLLKPGAFTIGEAAEIIGISRQSLLRNYCNTTYRTGEGRFQLPPHIEVVRDCGEVKFLRVGTPPRAWKRRHTPQQIAD